MKKYLLLIIVATLLSIANAQSENHSNIPPNVLTAFAAKYPGITVKKWSEVNNEYLAKFSDGRRKHTAYYNADGSWLKTDTKYTLLHPLPEAVKTKWKSCYFASWYIESIHETESPKEHDYVMLMDFIHPWDKENIGSQRQVYVTFSPAGQIIKMDEVHTDN